VNVATTYKVLTEHEVSFEVVIEPEELELEGNVMACGDDAVDRAAEQEIRARLNRGEVEAWCWLAVTATWKNPDSGKVYTATRGIGSVSLDVRQHPTGDAVRAVAEAYAEESELYAEALDALNHELRDAIVEASSVIQYLVNKPKRSLINQQGRAVRKWQKLHGLSRSAHPTAQQNSPTRMIKVRGRKR
jgi:hypothetical protein